MCTYTTYAHIPHSHIHTKLNDEEKKIKRWTHRLECCGYRLKDTRRGQDLRRRRKEPPPPAPRGRLSLLFFDLRLRACRFEYGQAPSVSCHSCPGHLHVPLHHPMLVSCEDCVHPGHDVAEMCWQWREGGSGGQDVRVGTYAEF